jgi:four helix bundle protein
VKGIFQPTHYFIKNYLIFHLLTAENTMIKRDLEERTKLFSLDLIEFVECMPKSRAADIVGRQLLRSGTSIGANYREASRSESNADFIHKIGISTKEAAETQYWLELVNESKRLQTPSTNELLQETGELLAILITIGKNSKNREK